MSDEVPGDVGRSLAAVAATLGVGLRVAGYRLEEQIGQGGMAVVFRARDERLGRQVALKVLAPALAADEAFRHRFIGESRAAATVDDPHIIPVYEAGEAGGVLFIAMRYVPGGDVRTLLHREGPLGAQRAAAIISAVASALDAAHAVPLIHRDVKPANMLLDGRPDRPDHVYLSDFGLNKGESSAIGVTGPGQVLGTPNYMAPEQIEGRAVDGRTDQYALACTAFELLTGQPPFQHDTAMAVVSAQVLEPPPPLSSRRPGLPAAADQVFARALAKVPGNRFANCREFADALRQALGLAPYHSLPPSRSLPPTVILPPKISSPPDRAPIPPTVPMPPSKRRWTRAWTDWRLITVAVIAAAIVILALVLLGRPARPSRPLSAAKAVAAVQPDRLAEALLDSRFAQNEVPRGTSESSPQLTNFRAAGLVASVYTNFPGSDASIAIHYYVYDNQAAASSAFASETPLPSAYTAAGRFTARGIGDPSKCATGQAPSLSARWATGCFTLSNTVVGFAVVLSNTHDNAAAESLTRTLARDTIRHLQDSARKTQKAALPPPPAHLTPNALFSQLDQSSFNPAWLPAGSTSPTVQAYADRNTPPPGLLNRSYIQVTLQGPDHGDYIDFYVFGSPREAQSWFNIVLRPTGSTKTGPIDSSGFSQRSYCGTYSRGASQQFPKAAGISACYVLWGNVVINGQTQSIVNKQAADNNMAVTLTRMGVIYLDQKLT